VSVYESLVAGKVVVDLEFFEPVALLLLFGEEAADPRFAFLFGVFSVLLAAEHDLSGHESPFTIAVLE
jgi:hypothetical protein